ncbi:hypothetical protein SISNIDRAFT_486105 [Sistotremastrum niveocremeum HHB9708]|uniref:Uncharacterized protein n=1 Tax=Sistotremastrum niveocremeum HHB9708 TaxID=1314777 RepID=A0A164UFL6_9AGAM|nr:hypothetical protein SISNIDRAFT_486105 [Sistotremastrum niveocremeum HHB9708]
MSAKAQGSHSPHGSPSLAQSSQRRKDSKSNLRRDSTATTTSSVKVKQGKSLKSFVRQITSSLKNKSNKEVRISRADLESLPWYKDFQDYASSLSVSDTSHNEATLPTLSYVHPGDERELVPSQHPVTPAVNDICIAEEPTQPSCLHNASTEARAPPVFPSLPSPLPAPREAMSSSPSCSQVEERPKLLPRSPQSTTLRNISARGRTAWSEVHNFANPTSSRSSVISLMSSNGTRPSSVMLYAPLEPNSETRVEVAQSRVVSICLDDEGSQTPPRVSEPQMAQTAQTNQASQPPGSGPGISDVADTLASKDSAPRVQEVTIWEPSSTKISFQATWWGYRIFIPPPILAHLSNKQLEAKKRAALLTNALNWLLDNIPPDVLPLEFRPILFVIRGLIPLVGLVAGFIAWSWSNFQAFDKGNGIILSATWLLPVVLVPGTWESLDESLRA